MDEPLLVKNIRNNPGITRINSPETPIKQGITGITLPLASQAGRGGL